jgi:hypothetical protein
MLLENGFIIDFGYASVIHSSYVEKQMIAAYKIKRKNR